MSTVMVTQEKGPGCLIQVVWFALVGWWLGQLWIAAAWACFLSVIGIPFGVMLLNKLPQVIALRGTPTPIAITTVDGVTFVTTGSAPQLGCLLRAVYFVFIGWWFSALWMELAYLLCLSIIGLPLGFWMFDRTPAIVSLRQG